MSHGRWGAALRVIGAVVLAVGVAGCWPAPGQNPNRDAFNPFESALTSINVASLAEVWSAPLDGPVFEPANNPSGEIVTGHGGVFVNDARAAYRFDPATGHRDWKLGLPTFPPGQSGQMGQALVVGDDLLVGYGSAGDSSGAGASWGSRVVDPATGSERLVVPGGMPVAHRDDDVLLVANQCIESFACTASYSLVDVNTGLGSRGTIGVNINRYPPPTLGSERIYSIDIKVTPNPPSSRVQAHPLTGNPASPIWVTDLAQPAQATAPVLSPDESTIYVGTAGSAVGHTLFALDAASGAIRWSTDVVHPVTAAPALAGGVLYVPTSSGLVAVDTSGTVLWTAASGKSITDQPAIAGGVVYVGTDDGTVAAFDVDGCGAVTCAPLWSDETGAKITSAPVVSGGRLYVVSGVSFSTGRLIAYGL
jgi:outer membrane protein assembly factor BamB